MNEVHEPRWYVTGLTVVRLSVLIFIPVRVGLFASIALLCGILDPGSLLGAFDGFFRAVCMHSGWYLSVPCHSAASRLDRHTNHLHLYRHVSLASADNVTSTEPLSAAISVVRICAAGGLRIDAGDGTNSGPGILPLRVAVANRMGCI